MVGLFVCSEGKLSYDAGKVGSGQRAKRRRQFYCEQRPADPVTPEPATSQRTRSHE